MILLFSGGLDSVCAWYLLGQPRCLYVKLGHRYQATELQAIQRLRELAPIQVTYAERLGLGDREQDDAYIPLRNLYLTMMASEYDDVVALGALKGEYSFDKDARFERLTTQVLSHCLERPVKVVRPVAKYTKSQLVRHYLRAGGSEALLRRSVSCYHGGFCGVCQSCFRRWVAMSANGIVEHYQYDPASVAHRWGEGLQQHGWRGLWRTLPSNWEALKVLVRQ